MQIDILDNNNIERIYHFSDIHVRRDNKINIIEAINKFTDYLKNDQNSKKSIIMFTGDFFDKKMNDGETLNLALFVLEQISKMMPVFIIPGNHDLNMNNLIEEDSISVIVKKVKNVYYLKYTGIYNVNNLSFVHISRADIVDVNLNMDSFKDKISIGLYHGQVYGSTYNTIKCQKNEDPRIDKLSKLDYVLLGDIHEPQFIVKDRIGYSGSFVQQNAGEDMNKGFILWDLVNKKASFIPIDLESGTYVYNIKDDIDSTNLIMQDLIGKKNINFVLKTNNCSLDFIETIKNKVNKMIIDNNINLLNPIKSVDTQIKNKNYKNVLDIKYHIEYIKNNVKEPDLCEKVIKYYNETYSALIPAQTNTINKWSIKAMFWGNLFCYGVDNYLDFTRLKGLHGIIYPNQTGKSSIFDILIFILFNANRRISTGINVSGLIRKGTKYFYGAVIVSVESKDYLIVRSGYDKHTYIQLYEITYSTEKTNQAIIKNITANDIPNTYKVFHKIIGSYDIFMMLNYYSTDNLAENFLFLKKTDRRIFISNLLNLNALYDIFKKEKILFNKTKLDIKKKQKDLESENLNESEITKNIENCDNKTTEYKQNIIKCKEDINFIYNEIKNNLLSKPEENTDDIILISNQIKELENNIQKIEKDYPEFKQNIKEAREQLYKKIIPFDDKLTNIDFTNFNITDYNNLEQTIKSNKEKINEIDILIDKLHSDIEILNESINLDIPAINYDSTILEYTQDIKDNQCDYIPLENINEDEIIKNKQILKKPTVSEEKISEEINKYQAKVDAIYVSKENFDKMKFDDNCQSCNNNKSLIITDEIDKSYYLKLLKLKDDWDNYNKNLQNDNLYNKIMNNRVYTNIQQLKKDLIDLERKREINNQNKDKRAKIKEYNNLIKNNKIDKEKLFNENKINKIQMDKLIEYKKYLEVSEIIENNKKQKDILVVLDNYETNINKIDLLIKRKNKYNEYKINFDKYVQSQEKCAELEQKKLYIENQKEFYENEINNLKSLKKENEEKLKKLTKISNEIESLIMTSKISERMSSLFSPVSGLPRENLVNFIENFNNNSKLMFSRLCDFYIKLDLVNLKKTIEESNIYDMIDVYIIKKNSQLIFEVSASGSQRFISCLLSKIILRNICTNTNEANKLNFGCDMLFIDEGFGCLDADNLKEISVWINNMQSWYSGILVISHLDLSNTDLKKDIKIKKENEISTICDGETLKINNNLNADILDYLHIRLNKLNLSINLKANNIGETNDENEKIENTKVENEKIENEKVENEKVENIKLECTRNGCTVCGNGSFNSDSAMKKHMQTEKHIKNIKKFIDTQK